MVVGVTYSIHYIHLFALYPETIILFCNYHKCMAAKLSNSVPNIGMTAVYNTSVSCYMSNALKHL